MAGQIVPRPIALVSTISESGVRNLAPFSYFMPGGVNPPTLCFCTILGRDGRRKDTLQNIEATGEYVVNLVHRGMAESMNETGYDWPADTDEWPLSGLTPLPSTAVHPERVAESHVHFECRLHQIAGMGIEAGAGVFVIGEIVAIHAVETPAVPIARLGQNDYLDLDGGKVFEMLRPKGLSSASLKASQDKG